MKLFMSSLGHNDQGMLELLDSGSSSTVHPEGLYAPSTSYGRVTVREHQDRYLQDYAADEHTVGFITQPGSSPLITVSNDAWRIDNTSGASPIWSFQVRTDTTSTFREVGRIDARHFNLESALSCFEIHVTAASGLVVFYVNGFEVARGTIAHTATLTSAAYLPQWIEFRTSSGGSRNQWVRDVYIKEGGRLQDWIVESIALGLKSGYGVTQKIEDVQRRFQFETPTSSFAAAFTALNRRLHDNYLASSISALVHRDTSEFAGFQSMFAGKPVSRSAATGVNQREDVAVQAIEHDVDADKLKGAIFQLAQSFEDTNLRPSDFNLESFEREIDPAFVESLSTVPVGRELYAPLVAAYDNHIYVLGGYYLNPTERAYHCLYRYDIENDYWSALTSVTAVGSSRNRAFGAMAFIGQKLHVTHGDYSNASNNVLYSTTDWYAIDVEEMTFTGNPSHSTPSGETYRQISAVAVGDSVYVFSRNGSNRFWIWNSISNTVQGFDSGPAVLFQNCAHLDRDTGKIYLFGCDDGSGSPADVYCIHTEDQTSSSVARMSFDLSNDWVRMQVGRNLYFLGGENNDTYRFSLDDHTWRKLDTFTDAEYQMFVKPSFVQVGDDLFVIGGKDANNAKRLTLNPALVGDNEKDDDDHNPSLFLGAPDFLYRFNGNLQAIGDTSAPLILQQAPSPVYSSDVPEGHRGYSLLLDGSWGLTRDTPHITGLGAMSFGVKFKPTKFESESESMVFGQRSSAASGFAITLTSLGEVRVRFNSLVILTPPLINFDQWNHVGAVRDINGSVWVVVNGELAATAFASPTNISTTQRLTIGYDNVSNVYDNFKGSITEVFGYSKALTLNEMAWLASGRPLAPELNEVQVEPSEPEVEPRILLRLDGNLQSDSTHLPMIMAGDVIFEEEEALGRKMLRTSPQSYLRSYETPMFESSSEFTVTVRVRLEDIGATSGIFSQNMGGGYTSGFLCYVSASGAFGFNTSASGGSVVSSPGVVRFGQSAHLTVVRKDNVVSLFVNGNFVASGSHGASYGGSAFYIGRTPLYQGSHTSQGAFSDFMVFDHALSQEEILWLADARNVPFPELMAEPAQKPENLEYNGVAAQDDFVDAATLINTFMLSATEVSDSVEWLSFDVGETPTFVAKQPIATMNDAGYARLLASGLATGHHTITVNGELYSVRLMYGLNSEGREVLAGDLSMGSTEPVIPAEVRTSEFSTLLGSVHNGAHRYNNNKTSRGFWPLFGDEELGLNSGSWVIGSADNASVPRGFVRGSTGLQSAAINASSSRWRPVLERTSPKAPVGVDHFEGEISGSELIPTTTLCRIVGISSASASPWLKFTTKYGQTVYVAKHTVVNTTLESLARRGLLYGDNQIVIGRKLYKVRSLEGLSESFRTFEGNEYRFSREFGGNSEWTRLLGCVHDGVHRSEDYYSPPGAQAQYSDSDLDLNSWELTSGVWLRTEPKEWFIALRGVGLDDTAGTSNINTTRRWRPVLELVGDAPAPAYEFLGETTETVGEEFYTEAGVSGPALHTDVTWLKFRAPDNGLVLMPKKPLLKTSMDELLANELVEGNRIIQLGEHLFKIRLIRGRHEGGGNLNLHLSEWNQLVHSLLSEPTNDLAQGWWSAYTIDELGETTSPDYTWCQELNSATVYVLRHATNSSLSTTSSSSSRLWRPLLEYVGVANNDAPDWVGDALLAVDAQSTINNVDYVGNELDFTRVSIAEDEERGRVLKFSGSSSVVASLQFPQQSFTLDFYMKTNAYNWVAGSSASMSDRLLFGVWDSDTSKMAIWNNQTNPVVTWDIGREPNGWEHWRVLFTGSEFRMYVNGELLYAIELTPESFEGLTARFSARADSLYDRIRLRAGVHTEEPTEPEPEEPNEPEEPTDPEPGVPGTPEEGEGDGTAVEPTEPGGEGEPDPEDPEVQP